MEFTTLKGDPFSPDQVKAAEYLSQFKGRSVILTGAAGSGKSEVVKWLLRSSHRYAVCSTTARSALLVGGITVDRVFCFSRDSWEVWNGQYLGKVMNELPECIIIDEASMIGANMANIIGEIADAYQKTVIMVGDWAQAQPVNDDWPFDCELFSKAEVLQLSANHRQVSGDYLSGLNDIRKGLLTDNAQEVFAQCIARATEVDERSVRIFATNAEVAKYNDTAIRKYCKESGEIGFGCVSKVQDTSGKMTDEQKQSLIGATGFAHRTSFAVGCRAMIVRNSDRECPQMFVNGDTGVVMDAVYDGKNWSSMSMEERKTVWRTTPNHVRLKLDRGPLISVPHMKAQAKDALGNTKQTVTGIPLTVGYAYTIHKTQGMTIPRIFVGMNSMLDFPSNSRHGLAYVAMSRAPELSGLSMDGLSEEAVWCDPIVWPLVEGN